MSPIQALIVDDEPDICQLAEITLNRMGIDTSSAYNLADAKNLLRDKTFNLCLTDMNLPDGNGIELVEHIQQSYPQIPVAVITAYGNVESAVTALKAGAFDFISKPVDLKVLRRLVESSLKLDTGNSNQQKTPNEILGESQKIAELRKTISKIARSQAPIFIHGESGSGKELAARQIHIQGPRVDNPFIPVNCGAIPTELVESEFFGHKKGSFTGATEDKEGLFLAANNGTLFLDEIAELPLQMQVKLLRALQEKKIRPIGSNEEKDFDVRILCASHQDIGTLVKEGKFRQDLYYRINVIQLSLPSLSQRPSDIPLLAKHFISIIKSKLGLTENYTLSESALEKLQHYSFPGNVRELENILERAIALSESSTLTDDDLQINDDAHATQDELLPDNANRINLANAEKDNIIQALEKTRWNKTAAAKLLGITLRQLRYRLEKHKIE